VRVAVVENRLRGRQVKKLVSRTCASVEEAPAVVRRALDELDFDEERDYIAAVAPGDRVTSRLIAMPLTQRRQIAEALPFELESLTPFDADEIVCDFMTAGAAESGVNILAVAATRDTLAEFLGVYEKAGLDPDLVIPAPLAVAAQTRYVPPAEGAMDALVYAAPDAVCFALATAGGVRAIHADVTAGGGGAVGAIDPARLVREIKRLFLAVNGPDGTLTPGRISLGGVIENFSAVKEALEASLGVRVEKARLPGDGAALDRGPGADTSNTAFTAVLGAALIQAGTAAADRVNLRQGAFKRKPRIAGQRSSLYIAAALLALVAVVSVASYVAEGVALRGRHEDLKKQIRAEFTGVLPEIKNIVLEKQQLINALARIEQKTDALGAGEAGGDPFLDRLLDITSAAPKSARLDVDEYLYEPRRIVLGGRTGSYENVDQFKKNIERLTWSGKVEVSRAKAGISADTVSFRLEVEVAP